MNFDNQFIEIFRAGTHTDDQGKTREITTQFLEEVVRNFSPSLHEPPAVIGHPADNAPAFGWVEDLRLNGDVLEAKFKEVDPSFEEMVRAGRFKKRSA